jgi:hypothetical protein
LSRQREVLLRLDLRDKVLIDLLWRVLRELLWYCFIHDVEKHLVVDSIKIVAIEMVK